MKEKIVLKSTHPEKYPDLVVECRVISNDKIGEYLKSIPEERKLYAHKEGFVAARKGVAGEVVKTTLKTIVDGKEYILSEEENTVKMRECDGVMQPDIVVTNISSTSNERYVVKHKKFVETYTAVPSVACHCGNSVKYQPVADSRLLTQVDENIIIMTSWGAPAVCLAGSYIVTYSAEGNDYNTIEQGAFNSTYVIEEEPTKKLRK